MEKDGYDYLIENVDVAKDALAFIEMLQLRLQFQIKVKLSNLDNTDLFRVHNNEINTSFDQKALDVFSKTLYITCPINKQRTLVKALKTAVPELSGNIKTADVLNKHCVEMLDVTVCGNETAKENTADSELLRQDIKKEATALVFESSKNKKKCRWCHGCKDRRRLRSKSY